MSKLIKGGIYTINDSVYAFVKHQEYGRLKFLEIEKPHKLTNEIVNIEIRKLIVQNSRRLLQSKYVIFDGEDFFKNYDGFIGLIDDDFTFDTLRAYA